MSEKRCKIIISRSEEDEAFIAEVPKLSGCGADGSRYQDALTNDELEKALGTFFYRVE